MNNAMGDIENPIIVGYKQNRAAPAHGLTPALTPPPLAQTYDLARL